MDKSREILLNDLTKKIELLISKYEQVRAEKTDLSLKLAQCKEELENSNNKIKESAADTTPALYQEPFPALKRRRLLLLLISF